MSRTVVMYNVGKKMLCRLYIAMKTLRRHWDGHVIMLAEEPLSPVREWCKEFDIDFVRVNFSTPDGRKKTYLNACECWKFTRGFFDSAMWLDSDTITLGSFVEMFEAAEKNEFAICNFADWPTETGLIASRIKSWEPIYPDKIEKALAYGHGINCGVFSYRHDSKWMQDWHGLAIPGRDISFIPDETCCQLHLPFYEHKLMPKKFNESCKYGLLSTDTRILHYHGNKHCRFDEKDNRPLNNCLLWYNEFEESRGEIEHLVQHDKQLKQNIKTWDETKHKYLVTPSDDWYKM